MAFQLLFEQYSLESACVGLRENSGNFVREFCQEIVSGNSQGNLIQLLGMSPV